MMIGSQELGILLFTEVIPKGQQKPIAESQLNVKGTLGTSRIQVVT